MIRVQCACGKQYDVKEQFAGKRFKCKACDAALLVPKPKIVPTAEAIPVQAVVIDPPAAQPVAVPQTAPQTASPQATTPTTEAELQRVTDELKRFSESSSTMASNPGLMRISRWRWFLAFPMWPIIWHLPLLVLLGLACVGFWPLLVPASFFALASCWYWRRVKVQFIAGCVNPGKIVSLDPPLVAVITNLSKGGPDCNVIKVLSQPLSKMAGGAPQIGQLVATSALYEGFNQELDHWDNFSPIVIDCVTANQADIARVTASIDAEDWQELADAMPQVPSPPTPGLYRIYTPAELAGARPLPPGEIRQEIELTLAGCRNCHLACDGIDPKHRQQASAYISPQHSNDIIALIETAKVSSDAKEGFAFTPQHALFNFQDIGKGAFAWGQLAGAFLNPVGLELAFRDGRRLMILKTHFLWDTGVRLENLFRAICNA